MTVHGRLARHRGEKVGSRCGETVQGIDVTRDVGCSSLPRMGQLMSRCPRRRSAETNQRLAVHPRPNDTCRLKGHDIQPSRTLTNSRTVRSALRASWKRAWARFVPLEPFRCPRRRRNARRSFLFCKENHIIPRQIGRRGVPGSA